MHRITKNKTKVLQIAVVAVFMAVAVFAAKPAQAKFGLMGGYKYVGVQGTPYTAHVGQLDFLWTIRGGGIGYRDGGKRPKHVFGFGLAVGGNSLQSFGSVQVSDGFGGSNVGFSGIEGVSSSYFAMPLIYEYVFANGLGITSGITLPIMGFVGGSSAGVGIGFGISDLGLSYHFNNGLTLYGRTNLGYASFFGADTSQETVGSMGGVMWAGGAGLGYWF